MRLLAPSTMIYSLTIFVAGGVLKQRAPALQVSAERFESSGSWLNFLHFSKSEALFQKPE
jgi:hypothetical protein